MEENINKKNKPTKKIHPQWASNYLFYFLTKAYSKTAPTP